MHVVAAGPGQQARGAGEITKRAGNIAQHLAHMLGVGPRRFGRRLGTPQLRCRHHLHCLGDFLGRLGRGDPNAHVFEAGHESVVC
jgi:hypothetical protein